MGLTKRLFFFILLLVFDESAGAQFLREQNLQSQSRLLTNDIYKPVREKGQDLFIFPDSLKKFKKKKCCNSWCFGTSFVPVLNLVSYNSFVLNEKVKFRGIRLGAEIGDRIRFGIGRYELDDPVELPSVTSDIDTLFRQMTFEYYNLFWEFAFYKDFRWELALPLSMGRAFGQIDTFSRKGNFLRGHTDVDSTFLFTVGLDAEYRFIPWLGIGGGIGYRQSVAPRDIREKIDAPYYTIKLKVFLGYLFKAIFQREKLQEEKEEYLREKEERKEKRRKKREKEENSEGIEKVDGITDPVNKNDY